jgi:hypothetical protein
VAAVGTPRTSDAQATSTNCFGIKLQPGRTSVEFVLASPDYLVNVTAPPPTPSRSTPATTPATTQR